MSRIASGNITVAVDTGMGRVPVFMRRPPMARRGPSLAAVPLLAHRITHGTNRGGTTPWAR